MKEKLKKVLKYIPAPIVLIPLLAGILLNLLLDSTMSAATFKGYSETVKTISTVLLMFLVFGICAQMDFKKMGEPFKRGGILLAFKLLTASVIGGLVLWIAGPSGFLGISVLALVAALSNNNNAIYAGLAKKYGEKNDVLSIMLLVLVNSPAFTVIFMVAGGGASVDVLSMLLPFIPIALGIAAGNIWPKARPILYKIAGASLPIFCLLLGTTISVSQAAQGGLQGMLLGLIVVVIGVGAFFLSRVYMGKKKYAPVAAGVGTVASSAILTPVFIEQVAAAGSPVLAYVNVAVAQLAGAVIISSILAPVLVMLLFKWEQKRREKLGLPIIITTDEEAAAEEATTKSTGNK